MPETILSNRILSSLTPDEYSHLAPHLKHVSLNVRHMLRGPAVKTETTEGTRAFTRSDSLDISMPEMNGLEAASILRKEVPQAMIVVISQHDPVQLRPRVVEAGAADCVDKGRLSSDLLAVIKRSSLPKE